MRLYRWQGATRNFGDELNTLLWPRLLPSFFDEDATARFLGIGSILDARHPPDVIKVVAGAGYGGYEAKARIDGTWRIQWVRGPRTARFYGLPANLALGDPASLIGQISGTKPEPIRDVGFMPHFESAASGNWTEVAAMAGVHLIDPRGDPAAIIDDIARCRMIVSEALHGVIAADALRVPWIAVRPLNPVHRAKWHDWAEALPLQLRFHHLPPSSLLEKVRASVFAGCHVGRNLLHRHAAMLRQLGTERFVARGASALTALASHAPQLSTETALDRCQTRMMERLEALRRSPLSPRMAMPDPEPSSWRDGLSHLRPLSDSAYHAR